MLSGIGGNFSELLIYFLLNLWINAIVASKLCNQKFKGPFKFGLQFLFYNYFSKSTST